MEKPVQINSIEHLLSVYPHSDSFRTLGELIFLMEQGIVEFSYLKKSGELRRAKGTLNQDIIASVTGKSPEECHVFNDLPDEFLTKYFDLESVGGRTFDHRRLQIPDPMPEVCDTDPMKAELRRYTTSMANGLLRLQTGYAYGMYKKAWEALSDFDAYAEWALEDREYDNVEEMQDFIYMEIRDMAKCDMEE